LRSVFIRFSGAERREKKGIDQFAADVEILGSRIFRADHFVAFTSMHGDTAPPLTSVADDSQTGLQISEQWLVNMKAAFELNHKRSQSDNTFCIKQKKNFERSKSVL
jgi:hypothetical protein